MAVSLKQYITDYCISNEYDVSKEGLYETFEECFDIVAKTWEDKHPWHTRKGVVRKVVIDGIERFFEDEAVIIGFEEKMHNENEKTLDDIVEVFPKEVTAIVYVTQDKL